MGYQALIQRRIPIGLKALDLIHDRFQVKTTEDESGFIAIHLVNYQ